MKKLRARYGPQRTDSSLWVETLDSYHTELQFYEERTLKITFRQASLEHAEWFPSLGQLMRTVKASEKTVQSTRPKLTEGTPFRDPEAASKIRDIVAELGKRMVVD